MNLPDWHVLTAAANDDPETRLALKNAKFCAAIRIGDQRILLEANSGTVRVGEPSSVPDFELRGPRTTWEDYSSGQGVQTNSIMSMARQGHLSKDGRVKSEFEFDGDQRKLWANFRALDLILQQLRRRRT